MTTQEIQDAWKSLAQAKANTAEAHAFYILAYATLVEAESERTLARLKRAFSPITNPRKLANGFSPYQALQLALWHSTLKNQPSFGLELTEEHKQVIRELATELRTELEMQERMEAIAARKAQASQAAA